jgi:arylsulfatase A-like enzyme
VSFNVYAPHSPAKPAPRHEGLFPDARVPQTPSFNEADISDKPPFMQSVPELTPEDVKNMDAQYRRRLQSLAAVDEAVAHLVETLKETGQLNNTYIVFASDNGYHMGQHRLMPGKGMPYEEDIKVPLIVRGPGVRKNAVREDLAAFIDLAPTFAEIAGTQLSIPSDGRSLLPLLTSRQPVDSWRKSVFLEHYSPPSKEENETLSNALEPPDPGEIQQAALAMPAPDYIGIRTPEYKYIQRIGTARELYDLTKDPYELENRWQDADEQFKQELAAFMEAYRTCAGATCRDVDALEPPLYRLNDDQ